MIRWAGVADVAGFAPREPGTPTPLAVSNPSQRWWSYHPSWRRRSQSKLRGDAEEYYSSALHYGSRNKQKAMQ